MRPRDILAANLKSLMKARPELSRFPDITKASDDKLTNGTLDRVRRADVSLTVDKLADLAQVFGLEPWQLLVENLNPKALPQLADATFVSHLQKIIEAANARTEEKSPSLTDEHPVQDTTPVGNIQTGPALLESFEPLGKKKNARRRTAAPPKPKGGRSR